MDISIVISRYRKTQVLRDPYRALGDVSDHLPPSGAIPHKIRRVVQHPAQPQLSAMRRLR